VLHRDIALDIALASGIDDYLVKPMDPRRLREALVTVQPRHSDRRPGHQGLTEDLGARGAADVLETFRQEAPALIEHLHAVVRAKDREALRHAAHALESPAQSCGLARIGAFCQELEASAADMDGQRRRRAPARSPRAGSRRVPCSRWRHSGSMWYQPAPPCGER
jgi:HPt (histidine-containing phosphotransfer) domain-containing protein